MRITQYREAHDPWMATEQPHTVSIELWNILVGAAQFSPRDVHAVEATT